MHNKVMDELESLAAVRVLCDGVGVRVLPLVDFCEDSYLRRVQQNGKKTGRYDWQHS